MIITKQKDVETLVKNLSGRTVFLVGCSECATLCHTGGEGEVVSLKTVLESHDIVVSGWVVLDPACHLMNDKRMLKTYDQQVRSAEVILVLACGNGVQTVAELFPTKEVRAGTDTMFLGEISRTTEFDKRCIICGECLLDSFGGLCPLSRCPKLMLNGPCGGSVGGKCEVDSTMECVWDTIYQKAKQQGNLDQLAVLQPPKDWSKSLEMKRRL
ncbi:MAG: methylenetetrahydrofolate reductase C-terminal domain-containing protein [Candidatus Thermoplasmatota archaeon]|nr:methylenetetrahydrofolate reductase C-terminal domain-containing protein [Candidatus Thermoplasmatota archaeon]